MKCVIFCHAITSCWNNGNAHFLRGVIRELTRLGHEIVVYERLDGWSRLNAICDGGEEALQKAARLLRGARVLQYVESELDLDEAVAGADLVIAHEWNTPELIARLGRIRANGASYRLLFHDTHHRAITAPSEFGAFDLDGYDGALVFGEALRDVYLRRGLAHRVFTWHEAADSALFRPLADEAKDWDLVWIGDWGDDERSAELREFLIQPSAQLALRARVHGVRYPDSARGILESSGLSYAGWLPNHDAPRAFAQARVTVHIPRAPYVRALPGIPTIRVFEALACGIPLICSPWSDSEGLFPPGCYISVSNGQEMSAAISDLLHDEDRRAELVAAGLRCIQESHTCRHRAAELVGIFEAVAARTCSGLAQANREVALQ
jgi:spore maturation protein CgeB